MVDKVKRMIEWFYDIKKSHSNDVFSFWNIDSFKPEATVNFNRNIFDCNSVNWLRNLAFLVLQSPFFVSVPSIKRERGDDYRREDYQPDN